MITSAYLRQGTESNFEVACVRVMSSLGKCRGKRTFQAEEGRSRRMHCKAALGTWTNLSGWIVVLGTGGVKAGQVSQGQMKEDHPKRFHRSLWTFIMGQTQFLVFGTQSPLSGSSYYLMKRQRIKK